MTVCYSRAAPKARDYVPMDDEHFQHLGYGILVYVVQQEGQWVCRDARGLPLASFPEREIAHAAAKQYDMTPVDVH